jgi:hypothetical protein
MAGKKAFVDAKRGRCHSIASADITAAVKSEKTRDHCQMARPAEVTFKPLSRLDLALDSGPG